MKIIFIIGLENCLEFVRGIPVEPKKCAESLILGKQRMFLIDTFARLAESARDDHFPDLSLFDFVTYAIILHRIYEQNERGRDANASALERSTGVPRATLRRKLQELTKNWAIEPRGRRFVIAPEFFNTPVSIQGFKRRVKMVKRAAAKLPEIFP